MNFKVCFQERDVMTSASPKGHLPRPYFYHAYNFPQSNDHVSVIYARERNSRPSRPKQKALSANISCLGPGYYTHVIHSINKED